MSKPRFIIAGFVFSLSSNPIMAWSPGTYPAPSRNLFVNSQSRSDVVAFWHGVYKRSEGFEARTGWTGKYSTAFGAEGTTSPVFIADVQRRINFYRAMAGIPATASVNTGSKVFIDSTDPYIPPASITKSAAAQRGALMISMNYDFTTGRSPGFTHDPEVNSVWNAIPWNANNKSNLSQGVYGPDAIASYVSESSLDGQGNENSDAGHRRWVLKLDSTDYASGDIPDYYDPLAGNLTRRVAANVLYVLQNPAERAPLAPRFVPYPNSGYFPAPLNTRFWSLSRVGADFSTATVTVKDSTGKVIYSPIRSTSTEAGDPTIVWEMPPEHSIRTISSDRKFQVTVSGISGSQVPASYSYGVTLINPDLLDFDQVLSGPDAPHVQTPATYYLPPIPEAEAIRIQTYKQAPAAWKETAETNNQTAIIDRTANNYDLISPASFTQFAPVAGVRSFRLTHPTFASPADQIFELGRTIIPKSGATVKFLYRRGYMTENSSLKVEFSKDGGVTWAIAGNTIKGNSTYTFDTSTTAFSALLPASGDAILVRFRYHAPPNKLIFAHEINGVTDYRTYPTGIFLDEISLTNSEWLESKRTTDLPAGSTTFTLNADTAGGTVSVGDLWKISLRVKLGDRWFPEGPHKELRPSNIIPSPTAPPVVATPFDQWKKDIPGLSGGFDDDDDGDGVSNGIEYAFSTDPLAVDVSDGSTLEALPSVSEVRLRHSLDHARPDVLYEAQCSESLSGDWSGTNVKITIADGHLTASTPRTASGRCFLRWKITRK